LSSCTSSGRPEEAQKVWKRARDVWEELLQGYYGGVSYRPGLARTYAILGELHRQSGRPEEAVKVWERATARANALAGNRGVSAGTLYDSCCIFSLASAATKDDTKLSDQYATRALELLREAVAKGYKKIAHMKQDKDLDPLRSRDDFQKLLAQLEAGDGKKEP
jgi:tetratricopeptide (TPR) repeat protein